MKKYKYVIIMIIIITAVCFSWFFLKHNFPQDIPKRAKLVRNKYDNANLLFYKDVEKMGDTNYYKKRKNYINMEQENENEIRSDIEKKITDNVMRKYD